MPQTWWLKITEIYSFTVKEAECLKSRCGQGHVPSEACREILPCLLLASGGLFRAFFGVPRLVAASLKPLGPSSHDLLCCPSVCPFLL